MWLDVLGDHEYRNDIQEVLAGYFSENWTTAQSRSLEWEALKVVTRGESLAKTYGIWKKLDRELEQQEDALNAIQRQIDNEDMLENESRVVHGRIGKWPRVHMDVLKLGLLNGGLGLPDLFLYYAACWLPYAALWCDDGSN
ncbi:hypothetical protein NDU88_011991 [Pleurodeles waltl]|uniref:Uncharacterized protein n=1 Tax=Pleurodeles waltl TaxID=8319 RepID=A0AAV7R300_PLEWA|nr:hypothetical protein NDU88_011991 [Pleurodeles waltl]